MPGDDSNVNHESLLADPAIVVQDVPLQFVEKLARDAGAVVSEGFYSAQKGLNFKGNSDLVTKYDLAVEKLIAERIKQCYPAHAFFGEETSLPDDRVTDAPTWVIDPIDGTTNFVHGMPFCCVSIGFVVNKQPAIGVIYNPILDELFSAAAGHGSFLTSRNTRIRLDRSPDGKLELQDALISVGTYVSEIAKLRGELTAEVRLQIEKASSETAHNFIQTIRSCRDIRSLGCCSAEMAAVAMGRLDACFLSGVCEWDIAAGMVICREANCVVTDMDGKSSVPWHGKRVLLSVHSQLSAQIGSQLQYASIVERMGE